MHGVIRRIGPYRLKASRDRFGMLVRSIISQQISMGAARAIRARLQQLVGSQAIKPEMIMRLTRAAIVRNTVQAKSFMSSGYGNANASNVVTTSTFSPIP